TQSTTGTINFARATAGLALLLVMGYVLAPTQVESASGSAAPVAAAQDLTPTPYYPAQFVNQGKVAEQHIQAFYGRGLRRVAAALLGLPPGSSARPPLKARAVLPAHPRNREMAMIESLVSFVQCLCLLAYLYGAWLVITHKAEAEPMPDCESGSPTPHS